MRLLERIKRWLRLPRSYKSIVTEIAEGLRDGTIVITPRPDEPEEPSVNPPDTNGDVHPTPGLLNGAEKPTTSEPQVHP